LTDFKLTYKQYGERSILIEWPSEINTKILHDIIIYKENIGKIYVKEIIEVKSNR